MKKLIFTGILCTLSMLVFVSVGIPNLRQTVEDRSAAARYEEQNGALEQEVNSYEEALKNSSVSLKDSYSTNTELLGALAEKPFKLVSITAQKRNSLGDLEAVLTIDTVKEAAYFTNTIDCMTVTLKYSDFKNAYRRISRLQVAYRYISFDTENKVVTLTVDAIPVGGSSVSSEMNASPTQGDSAADGQQGEIFYVGGEEE